ncbi:hypothetical protein M3204_23485 [Mesobacillus subterraneus]|uniref:hypothetical protein n=1 Tax=Mesobacillus subterraneus TaxID=285983 RepID=UPI00203C6835|nr:hypothetical protein [Mesobacillus subterraneus]MCM3667341.1 hypothetical protein [Mesobacillus subterraneus]MCM3686325.1 hypothetical protein [Mesobacillus subterraneus]
MILKSFLVLSLLSALQPVENQNVTSAQPNIISLNTEYPQKGNWVLIPKGMKKITFNVKAENTETVLFWLMPTGTETWNQRKLIGYDIKEDDKDEQFTLTWNFDQPSLLDHLHIQALGEGIANDTINLIIE